MQPAANSIAVVILAGGEATRFPGKLESDAGGVPLLLRVYRNVRSIGPVYISANTILSDTVMREIDCTIVPDVEPGRGPLGGLISTFESVAQERCFVVAGDSPFVDAAVFAQLMAAWDRDVEAVVAERNERLEPLCALYARAAFLREARAELSRSGAVRAVVEKLRHRRVRLFDEGVLAGINTATERDALLGTFS